MRIAAKRSAKGASALTAAKTVAFIDSVALHSPSVPPGLCIRIEQVHGSRPIVTTVGERGRWSWGALIWVHQPSERTALFLDRLIEEYRDDLQCRLSLSRFAMAYDQMAASAEEALALRREIERTAILRWRPPSSMPELENGRYWCSPIVRSKGKIPIDALVYADRPSKTTMRGEPCCHFELRFSGADTVRRTGAQAVIDLLALNPRKLFDHHILLKDFDAKEAIEFEKYKQKKIRKAISHVDLECRPREYRKLERLFDHQNCVQRVHDMSRAFVSRLKTIPVMSLRLPTTVTGVTN